MDPEEMDVDENTNNDNINPEVCVLHHRLSHRTGLATARCRDSGVETF